MNRWIFCGALAVLVTSGPAWTVEPNRFAVQDCALWNGLSGSEQVSLLSGVYWGFALTFVILQQLVLELEPEEHRSAAKGMVAAAAEMTKPGGLADRTPGELRTRVEKRCALEANAKMNVAFFVMFGIEQELPR